MRRRTLIRLGGVSAVLAVGVLGVQQCRLTLAAPTMFSYSGHERPRVFVSHHPLIPGPGDTVTIRLVPDLAPNQAVEHATAVLHNDAGEPVQSMECPDAGDGQFTCELQLSDTRGEMAYSGWVDLTNGDRVSSRATYRFTVAESLAQDEPLAVRVPINATEGLAETYRVDAAWTRDPAGYDLESFISDLEQTLYAGVLRDPVYRWRDDQLGFWLFSREAFATSYYSGIDTRCGQNPWPRDASFPSALQEIEVLGVLHRKGTADGIEGSVTAPVGPDTFRDCAGQAVKQPEVGTFSAATGLRQSPLVAKHEYGHAAFGLGDEYHESTETRNVSAPPPPALDACCCVEGSTPGTGNDPGTGVGTGPGIVTRGLLQTMRCVGADGTIQSRPLVGSPPACGANDSGIPLSCFAGPDSGCPPLAGDCVIDAFWLGQSNPAPDARPNVFPSEEACRRGVTSATAHPGVEDPEDSLEACRELCGPSTEPCPCGSSEFWIADRDPDAGPSARDPADAMGRPARAALHGGTCIWCVETSLCVRWQRSLGNESDEAWDVCQAPPKEATAFERITQGIARAIGDFMNALGRIIRF